MFYPKKQKQKQHAIARAFHIPMIPNLESDSVGFQL